MEYVEIEVRARTVDLAVEAAMQELGVNDREQISIEVVNEPVKGFLGMGGQDAVVRVKRRRNRRNRGGRRKDSDRGSRSNQSQDRNRQRGETRSAKNESTQRPSRSRERNDRGRDQRKEKTVSDERPVLPIDEQVRITHEFLEGLVDAYGLDGQVTVEVSEEVIVADISGEQTEALVGVRGSVRSAIHELTRTVLQRYGQDSARLRLDIAGYAERRRQALSIYAEQLIKQLNEEGGEIMLEPMSPADRKVIHDVAAEHENITSYSEGEPPRRFVVLSHVGGEEE